MNDLMDMHAHAVNVVLFPHPHAARCVPYTESLGTRLYIVKHVFKVALFPGLQSPNAVEGLVKLLRRMTSGGRWVYIWVDVGWTLGGVALPV